MKPDLLKGIRIVDFTTYVAAPGAGRIMADWGADVIKVEGLTGDPMRSFGLQMGIPANDDVNPIWELENGNKRGITLDLKNPKGMEVMMKLLESADGMTTNVRLGSLKKMGLDYETLAKKFPKLVWGHVSGYGIYGEEAPRPGYDVVSFWARGGFLADTPTIGHPPMTTPFGVPSAEKDITGKQATRHSIPRSAPHFRYPRFGQWRGRQNAIRYSRPYKSQLYRRYLHPHHKRYAPESG